MNKDDLSRPPSDAALLHDIVGDVLSGYPNGSILSMSALLTAVRKQCPNTISNEDIARQITLGLRDHGFGLQFDIRP